MPNPRLSRVTVPTALLGALCGALLGLVTFAVVALLWRAGASRAAGLTAESALFLSLICLAATALLGQPARRRRARIPVDRAVPHAWWPREGDPAPLVLACIGVPLVAASGAAVLLFR